ncbi:alpha/beta fold hydrolase [Microbacterium sp. 4R-513]|uniref:alpha/beta fold hydrolase n=1 Tax=Microbacterium sp. 4R-513 TaxID=2567934 RepID=UPI0013E175AE|nr:alpha/beta fold hydrolase [Microbacterium sp. 4R-513]QIG38467.1 alpha/beta fold hydrolase [Microbacterium sp. 4R-513]
MTGLLVAKNLDRLEIVLERELRGGVEAVWRSWTTADELEAWWGPEGWQTTVRALDVRPGGLWHFGMGPVGSAPEVWLRAIYTEVIQGSLLSYVEGFSDETGADLDPASQRVTVEFIGLDEGRTRLVHRTRFPSAARLEEIAALGMVGGLGKRIRPSRALPEERAMTLTASPTEVRSADGTRIAVYRQGAGPAIILIDPALGAHKSSARLSRVLAPSFDVLSYDRRGRGGSGDAHPDTAEPAHEVEDIDALIDLAGGSAILFGTSSGAALALEAAARLGNRVTGVVAYEAPFICDDSRPPVAADLPARIAASVAAGDRSAAARAFFVEAVGVPRFGVAVMRVLPFWRDAKALTRTLRYDFALLDGLQSGQPLPAERWSGLTAPTVAMAGSKSPAFFHDTAKALAAILPTVEYEALEGGHHGTPEMSPDALARRILERFGARA